MKNTQRGSVSLLALLFSSFLLSLGGVGAAASYFQKSPNDFMAQLHTYFASRVSAEELAPLDTPTPTPTVTVTPTPTPDETITPASTPTPTPTPEESITLTPNPKIKFGWIRSAAVSQEELHESENAKIHEHEHGEDSDIED